MATKETAVSDTEGDITQHSENKNPEEENVLTERKKINNDFGTIFKEKNSPETQVKTDTASGNQCDINTENSQKQNLHEVEKSNDLGNRSLPENAQNYKSENNDSDAKEHFNVEKIEGKNVFQPNFYRWGNGLILIQGNIRSMRKNFKPFKDYLKLNSLKPNIIVLTEIWIYDEEIPNYLLEGYNCFFKRKDRKRAGGVIAYIADSIEANEQLSEFESADVLEIYFMWENVEYGLIAVYRSPSGKKSEFIEELSEKLTDSNERCIMTGDLNIDILKKTTDADNYLEMLELKEFISCHECVTRESKKKSTKTCLDHLFVKGIDLRDIETYVIKVNLSDHHFIGMHMVSNSDGQQNPSVEESLSITDTATGFEEGKLIRYPQN